VVPEFFFNHEAYATAMSDSFQHAYEEQPAASIAPRPDERRDASSYVRDITTTMPNMTHPPEKFIEPFPARYHELGPAAPGHPGPALPPLQGWECHKCGRVYAPFQAQCLFCGMHNITKMPGKER
jgi:hypothetical protein